MDKTHYISYSKFYIPKDKKQHLPEYLVWMLANTDNLNKKRTNYSAMHKQK